MATITQDDRSIAIATPLGENELLLKSMTFTEQLGRPFVIKVDLLSEEPAVDFLKLVGAAATIRWSMPDVDGQQKKRHFNGYIRSFVQRPRSEGFYCYEATLVPWLWFLTRTADCRIFHSAMSNPPDEMTVPGIIKKVFKDHGFDDVTSSLTGSYRKMDHCVQYRETDFNFVSRLMEQEGIYYFFEHVDEGETTKHKLKLVDAMGNHSEYPSYETIKYRASADNPDARGNILSWCRMKQVQPGAFKVNDFDFKRPKTPLLGGGTVDRNYSNSSFEMYDYAANYADEEAGDYGDKYGKLRIEELQAQYDVIVGQSDCPGIVCGSKLTLEDHPRSDENGAYLVVGVSYRCTAEAYKTSSQGGQQEKRFLCDFTAIPADSVFRPARTTAKPRIQGPQTGIVVGKAGEEILTDEFGRIKVQFHWDRYSPANENTPIWARVAQSWAGKNWGSIFIPRIGQEVIVEFLEGNPDRPIVTGAVYNGESKPPYALPDNATMSTIKSNSSKGGGGFNEFRFEDKKGSEQVFLHAEKDQDVRVKNDAKEWIGNDRHLHVIAKQYDLVDSDQHTHVKGDQLQKVDGTIGKTVGKDEISKISGNKHIAVTGDYVLKADGNLHEKVTGNHHEQTTGDIRLTATGHADISATSGAAVVSDGGNVHVKGMVVVIEGMTQLSLKAGANFIDIGPSGISISGMPMVNINSGGAAASGSGAQSASPSTPNDPDAVTDASNAADAQPGSSDTAMTAPTPPTPTQFSPSAVAMQEAASTGTAAVEQPSSP
jgi:type VI secretion system secreted protein VgrG